MTPQTCIMVLGLVTYFSYMFCIFQTTYVHTHFSLTANTTGSVYKRTCELVVQPSLT